MARAQQRRRGEHEGDQQAVSQRGQQSERIDHEAGFDRQQAGQGHGQKRGHRHAHQQPGKAARQRRRPDLERIDARDIGAARAQDLERRDRLAPRVEIGRHPSADPDTGDDERGKADQSQEFAHPADEAIRAGRRAIGSAEIESGFGEAVLQFVAHGLRIARRGESDTRLALEHRSRRKQSGSFRQAFRHDHGRAQLEPLAQFVGLGRDDPADGQSARADGDGLAGFDAEPFGSAAIQPGLVQRRCAHIATVLQGQCTVERIGIVDRLQADRHCLIAAPRHRLQPVSTRQRPVFGEGGVFLRVERTLPQFDFEVAAE